MHARAKYRNFFVDWLESRRLLSISFNATPISKMVAGISDPMEAAHFEGVANPVDLAVGDTDKVNVLSGNGDGTFTSISSIPYVDTPAINNPFIVGDFAGGGGDDIVMIGQNGLTGNTDLQYQSSDGNGMFSTGPVSSFAAPTAGAISAVSAVASDFNGDGKDDLAIVAQTRTAPFTLQLVEMLSNGDGTFTEHQETQVVGADLSNATTNTVLSSKILQVGDFGNGHHDLALYDGDSGHLTIFMNDGAGNLTQLPYMALAATTIAVGNLGGGTGDDIEASLTNGQLITLFGQGNGTFVNSGDTQSLTTPAYALAIGDFDLDGKPDVLTDGFVLPNFGDGLLQPPVALPTGISLITQGYTENLVIADFNGDGRPDFAGLGSDSLHLVVDLNTSVVSSTTTIAVNQPSTINGNFFTMTATVSTGLGTPAIGNVDFLFGNDENDPSTATTIATEPLVNGTATASYEVNSGVGSYFVFAKYEGVTGQIAASQSSSPAEEDVIAQSSITLDINPNPAVAGDPVSMDAIVNFSEPTFDDGLLGFVQFFDGSTQIDQEEVQVNDLGPVTFNDSMLSIGTHEISADFVPFQGSYSSPASVESPTEVTITPQLLQSTVLRSSVPATVVTGANSGGTILFSVKNNLQTPEHGALVVSVLAVPQDQDQDFFQVDPVTPTKLGTAAQVGVLAPGRLARVGVQIRTSNLTAGTYQLLAQVEGADGTTSNAVSGPLLTVAAPFVQLAVTLVKSTAPSTAIAGQPVRGALLVKIVNTGNIAEVGGSIAVYASADGTSHDGMFISVPLSKARALRDNGGAELVALPLRTAPSVPAGTYTLLVQTSDSQGNVAGVSAGQQSIVSPVVSLAVSIVGIAPAAVAPGKAAQLVINLTNSGNVNSQGRLAVTLSLLEADRVTNAQTPVTISVNRIVPPGGRLPIRLPLLVNKSTVPGSYLVSVAVTDGAGNATGSTIPNFTLVVS